MKSYGATDEMLVRAVTNRGNTARLSKAMQKAKKGEAVTLAVIGGSITQGSCAADKSEAYPQLLLHWWHVTFPDNKLIRCVNAGIGATDSYIGVHRVQRDVLSHDPDLVVVEFSVNDENEELNAVSYDNLVRRILRHDSKPAVILLFTTQENGTSFQDIHNAVGRAYDLPMISYKDAVLTEIAAGAFKWRDISPDYIHPNTRGHAIIGGLLCGYLDSVMTSHDTFDDNAKPSAQKDTFMSARILSSNDIEPIKYGSFVKAEISEQFAGNWTTVNGAESIIFEVEARSIGIMYYRTTDGKSGTYQAFVDNAEAGTLVGDFSGGWGNHTVPLSLFSSEESGRHTVEIRNTAPEKGGAMSIIGLLIS